VTTSGPQAALAELHTRIHQLEQDAKDREYYISHLKERNAMLMDKLRELGVPMVPVSDSAHHRPGGRKAP